METFLLFWRKGWFFEMAEVEKREAEASEGAEEEVEVELEEEEEEDTFHVDKPVPLKEQIELDKDDESLRKWKEDLLGSLDNIDGTKTEPEVTFTHLRIIIDGRDAVELPIPKKGQKVGSHFVLKEKSVYRLQFEFTVKNELLLGLLYANKVWRMGKQVHKRRMMLGAYGPQAEPYTFTTEEEVTPSGMLARGHYTAKTIFLDDDGRVHLEYDYTFDIKKDWGDEKA